MTIKELSEQYNITEDNIKKHFARVQDKLKQENINITRVKVAVGEYDYQVVPLYDNEIAEEGYIDYDILESKESFMCNILFTLSTYEQKGYGGSIDRFLEEQLSVPTNQYYKNKLKEVLQELKLQGYILYDMNKKDMAIGLTEKCSKDLKFQSTFLEDCKTLAAQCGLKSYVNVFKIFVAMFVLLDLFGDMETAITYKEISNLIGISRDTISSIFKKLSSQDIVRLGKLEYEINEERGTIKCKGRKIDINSFVISKPVRVLKRLTGD